jgi:hypothetical protein
MADREGESGGDEVLPGSGGNFQIIQGQPNTSLDDRTPDQAYFNLPPFRAAA